MIVVFGSINLDFVTRVARFPAPGETIAGESFRSHPGGKGANQALAAARAGATVRLCGAVGDDAFANAALALLGPGGVEVSGVIRMKTATGSATILVDAIGENCIAVVAGANALADPASVTDASIDAGALLLLQQEVPEAANVMLLARARRLGAKTLLNAAPARALAPETLRLLDFLVVNEGEAAALAKGLGFPGEPERFAEAAVEKHEALTVVVTLGGRGALATSLGGTWRAAAPPVEVIDTTGAGDAFVGALAAWLDRGEALPSALRAGVTAGALACTRRGAQDALPAKSAIDSLSQVVTLTGPHKERR
jgi:ribokinase